MNTELSRTERITLLRKSGWSVRAIAAEIPCAKSVVSYHTSKMVDPALPRNVDTRAATEKSKTNWQEKRGLARKQAVEQWPKIKLDPTWMGFLGIYWGEGHKSSRVVGVTNNSPTLIRAALNGFRKLSTAKITAEIRCYQSHCLKQCTDYWQSILPDVIVNAKRHVDKRSKPRWCERCPYGGCSLRMSDYRAYWMIMTWLHCWEIEILGVKA